MIDQNLTSYPCLSLAFPCFFLSSAHTTPYFFRASLAREIAYQQRQKGIIMAANSDLADALVDWVKLGSILKEARENMFGKRSLSKFCAYMNERPVKFKYDASNLRKQEQGLHGFHLSLDRIYEMCAALGLNPVDVIKRSLYEEPQLPEVFYIY